MSNANPRPSQNPPTVRLQVMVSPEIATTVRKLATLQKRSSSAVLRDFIEEVHPVLARVASLLELATHAQGKWPAAVVTRLEKMQSELEATALTAMDALDLVAADAPAAAGAVRRGRRQSPPMTNRGVTTRKPRPLTKR